MIYPNSIQEEAVVLLETFVNTHEVNWQVSSNGKVRIAINFNKQYIVYNEGKTAIITTDPNVAIETYMSLS